MLRVECRGRRRRVQDDGEILQLAANLSWTFFSIAPVNETLSNTADAEGTQSAG